MEVESRPSPPTQNNHANYSRANRAETWIPVQGLISRKKLFPEAGETMTWFVPPIFTGVPALIQFVKFRFSFCCYRNPALVVCQETIALPLLEGQRILSPDASPRLGFIGAL
jgi:hypothetical protein